MSGHRHLHDALLTFLIVVSPITSVSADGAGCSACDARVVTLEADVHQQYRLLNAQHHELSEKHQKLSARYNKLGAEVKAMRSMLLKLVDAGGESRTAASSKRTKAVGTSGSILSSESRTPANSNHTKAGGISGTNVISDQGITAAMPKARQLTAKSYAVVPALQVHEFESSGGACLANAGPLKSLLAVESGGEATFGVTPSDPVSDVSLVSVGDTWKKDEIQKFPAPIKVVHDASCQNNPGLELQLDTTVSSLTVSSTLMVGSTDVGAALASMGDALTDLSSGTSAGTSAGTWADLPLYNNFEALDEERKPQYMVMNGIVYLRGALKHKTSNIQPFSTPGVNNVAQLPAGARPYTTGFTGVASTSGLFRAGLYSTSGVNIAYPPTSVPNMYFDGVSFAQGN